MTDLAEKASHHLTCDVPSVTWVSSSDESSVKAQGGKGLPPRRGVISVFDANAPQSITKTDVDLQIPLDFESCSCGCTRFADNFKNDDGLSTYCRQMAKHKARRIG